MSLIESKQNPLLPIYLTDGTPVNPFAFVPKTVIVEEILTLALVNNMEGILRMKLVSLATIISLNRTGLQELEQICRSNLLSNRRTQSSIGIHSWKTS
jgi:hypothetical protein